MTALSARERKLVAVALLLAMIALVWLGIVQPIVDGFSARAQERDRLALEYGRNERAIAGIEPLRRAAEAQARLTPVYRIEAKTAEAAAETLKVRLEATLAKAGGEFRAAETVETSKGWARASATAVASYPQLLKWMATLANEPPYLVMEALTISADRALNSGRDDLLDVKLEVSSPYGAANAR